MKHKLGLMGFSYLAGLICAAFFKSEAVFILSGLLLAAFILLLHLKKKTAAVALFSAFAASVVCGIYTCTVYAPLAAKSGETVEISGRITEFTEYSGDMASYTIETEIDGVNAKITLFSAAAYCKTGDGISFTGKLSATKNNTNFSEESYYSSKGIFLKATAVSELTITPASFSPKNAVIDFSDYIGNKIGSVLMGDEGALLKAIFLGDKSDMSDSLSTNIKRAGISHFTAVSGLHLTIIAHIMMLLISLTPLKNHRYLKFLTLAAFILLFAVFFKLSVSVIRAGIMLIIYYGAEPFMRKGSTVNSMGAAILIITLFQPYACLDVGLLLSLSGTFGIGVISPHFCKKLRKTALYEIKATAVGTLCATIATLPFVCVIFNGFSLVGIISNLLLYPLFFPALVCMILFTLTLGYGTFLLFPAGFFARMMTAFINLLGSFKYSYIAVSYDIMIPIILLALIFVAVIYLVFKNKRETVLAIALSICVISGSVILLNITDGSKTKLLLYSEGNDACVIVKNGNDVFVAASSDSSDIAQYIKAFMQTEFLDKVTAIALLRTTRNNLPEFESIPCESFLMPDSSEESSVSCDTITLICKENRSTVKAGNISISLSPAADPIDDDISIIYGYKKNLPDLSGIVFCSSQRVNTEEKGYTNIYFDAAEYLITENGFLEPLKIFYM